MKSFPYKKNNIFNNYQISRLDIMLVMWLLFISGSPVIRLIPANTYITAIFGLIYCTLLSRYTFFKSIFIPVFFFVFVFFAQYYTLQYLPIQYPIGTLVTIIAGAFVYYKLGYKFRLTYFRVMYILSLISLIFWLLQNVLGLTIDLVGLKGLKSIIIWGVRNDPYNINTLEMRNSGPFWEPGAYAGYILVTGFLFINDLEKLYYTYKKEFLIIVTTLITTMSTTGYVILILLAFYWLIENRLKTSLISLIVFIPFGLMIMYVLFFEISFLGDKMSVEYESATTSVNGGNFSNTRLGALLFDIHYIEKHPFFGNGIDPKTRWADHPDLYFGSINGENLGHGNGFSGYLASMGIISFLFIVINIFISLKKANGIMSSIYVIILFLLLLQGESFLNYPLMLCLFFVKINRDDISFSRRIPNIVSANYVINDSAKN